MLATDPQFPSLGCDGKSPVSKENRGIMGTDSHDPLDLFPNWLRSLADDARAFAQALVDSRLDSEERIWIASALNYLLKSVDLIPDGVEDLGYLDDAFVLRRAAFEVLRQQGVATEHHPVVGRLSSEALDIVEFLGNDADRLAEYVSGLRISSVRGRSPSDIVEDENLACQVADETASWAESYMCPTFLRDDKTLVKLRAFLSIKLP